MAFRLNSVICPDYGQGRSLTTKPWDECATGLPSAGSILAAIVNDPALTRFRQMPDAPYGDRRDRLILFGSRARGDARPDSDYDVAVFLRSLSDRWAEFDRLARLRVAMIDETGTFFDAIPYPADAWLERTPLMHDIRRDGVEL